MGPPFNARSVDLRGVDTGRCLRHHGELGTAACRFPETRYGLTLGMACLFTTNTINIITSESRHKEKRVK